MATTQRSTHHPILAPIQAMAEQVRSDRRVALGLAVVLAAIAARVAGWLTPRGPSTSVQTLSWMAGALSVRVVAGP